jgi:hypothetical protein
VDLLILVPAVNKAGVEPEIGATLSRMTGLKVVSIPVAVRRESDHAYRKGIPTLGIDGHHSQRHRLSEAPPFVLGPRLRIDEHGIQEQRSIHPLAWHEVDKKGPIDRLPSVDTYGYRV